MSDSEVENNKSTMYRVIKGSATIYLIAESCGPIGISLQEKDYLIRLLNYSLQSNFHSIPMKIVYNITP